MDREQNTQLDLFAASASRGGGSRRWHSGILGSVHAYDKKVLLLITYIIIGIISFSLGVEKGKSKATAALMQRQTIATEGSPEQSRGAATLPPGDSTTPMRVIVQARLPQAAQAPVTASANGKFTIQVASFKTASLASKEAELLRKKGFSANVMNKGSYTILYVGSFSDKNAARSTLSKLKTRYSDCFVRRL